MPIELEGDANQEDEDDAAAPDAIPLEVEANPEDEDDAAAAPDAIPHKLLFPYSHRQNLLPVMSNKL